MIVGTQRSGTTLVQRLACEIPGIRVPPETQFFYRLAPRLLRNRRFPLDTETLKHEIKAYSRIRNLRQSGLDASVILDEVGDRATDIFELFSTIVRSLAGPALMYGEKSPRHLPWCRALGRRFPHLKFVAVVRDPRGVVASCMKLRWNTKSHIGMAHWWSLDQKYLLKTLRKLGPSRLLVLRYEDVVADPDAARAEIARFLDVPFDGQTKAVGLRDIALPRETWKANVTDPVDAGRALAWHESLKPSQIQDITALCRREMKAFGYREGLPNGITAYRRIAKIGLGQQIRRFRFSAARGLTVARNAALAKRIRQRVP